MGIEVLPPDVNASRLGFYHRGPPQMARQPPSALAWVRSRMWARAPVELILQARKDGPFNDLNDFARRVDLRAVGKRALECLIKVGALDCFRPAPALLEALDQIISVSTSHFRAADSRAAELFWHH